MKKIVLINNLLFWLAFKNVVCLCVLWFDLIRSVGGVFSLQSLLKSICNHFWNCSQWTSNNYFAVFKQHLKKFVFFIFKTFLGKIFSKNTNKKQQTFPHCHHNINLLSIKHSCCTLTVQILALFSWNFCCYLLSFNAVPRTVLCVW